MPGLGRGRREGEREKRREERREGRGEGRILFSRPLKATPQQPSRTAHLLGSGQGCTGRPEGGRDTRIGKVVAGAPSQARTLPCWAAFGSPPALSDSWSWPLCRRGRGSALAAWPGLQHHGQGPPASFRACSGLHASCPPPRAASPRGHGSPALGEALVFRGLEAGHLLFAEHGVWAGLAKAQQPSLPHCFLCCRRSATERGGPQESGVGWGEAPAYSWELSQ